MLKYLILLLFSSMALSESYRHLPLSVKTFVIDEERYFSFMPSWTQDHSNFHPTINFKIMDYENPENIYWEFNSDDRTTISMENGTIKYGFSLSQSYYKELCKKYLKSWELKNVEQCLKEIQPKKSKNLVGGKKYKLICLGYDFKCELIFEH